ncbi:MAG: hypothetical protein ABEL76_00785, partial [Bradymonadaceae bacterium]
MTARPSRPPARPTIARLATVAAAVLLVLSIGACSSGGGNGGSTGSPDAGDGGDGTSSGETPKHEDYFISYRLEDKAATGGGSNAKLVLYDTAEQSKTTVSPESVDCQRCTLSRDMKHFANVIQAGQGKFNVLVSDVGSDHKAEESSSLLVENVEDVEFAGNHVVYARSSDETSKVVYYKPLKGGPEKKLVELDSENETDADWHVDPDSG